MANTREVTIFGDEKARSGLKKAVIQAAVDQWANVCKGKEHIPHLSVDWENDRPPFLDINPADKRCPYSNSPAYRTTILIIFLDDEEADYDTQEGRPLVHPAEYFHHDNTIFIYGRCGHRSHGRMKLPCDEILDTIKWDSHWGSMNVAHEIGHALGLDHDPEECKLHGLMNDTLDEDARLEVIPEYCRLADDINNQDAECNGVETSSLVENPCNNL